MRLDRRSPKGSMKFCSDTCDNVIEIQKDMKELKDDMKKVFLRNRELEENNLRIVPLYEGKKTEN